MNVTTNVAIETWKLNTETEMPNNTETSEVSIQRKYLEEKERLFKIRQDVRLYCKFRLPFITPIPLFLN